MNTRTELLKWLDEEIATLQKEYDEQREATKKFRTPGNPYITGLGTKVMTLKDMKERVQQLTSLE